MKRKKIRKVMKNKKLKSETKQAQKAEEERRRRIEERQKEVYFLFLNQNICCGYSKDPSQLDASFEHPNF